MEANHDLVRREAVVVNGNLTSMVKIGISTLALLLVLATPVYADKSSWEYYITNEDQYMVDMAQTTADINNNKHEITLRKIMPKSVGLYEDEIDYIALSSNGFKHYSFDGVKMQEVEFLGINIENSNPISVCASSPYPDAVMYDGNSKTITHYSFSGTTMIDNPILSVSGMENIINIGTRESDLAFIRDDKFEYWGFTGEEMVYVPELSPEITNPIDFALFPDSYNMVVIDGNKVKYFKNGSEVFELTGFTNPISISANETAIAIVDGNEVKHYDIDEDSFNYSAALSISSTNPKCVAIKPGAQDRVVIDGNEIKYYSYDGSGLVYNSVLSTTVDDLDKIFIYVPNAIVVSNNPGDIDRNVDQVRVRAHCEVPDETSITWHLAADGEDWMACWRVRGTQNGSILEIKEDAVWVNIGNVTDAYPDSENLQLVFNLVGKDVGKDVRWKAELQGSSKVTPKIKAINGKCAVKLDINTKPGKPEIIPPEPEETNYCLSTATPTLEWSFNDPDDDDTQSGFCIQIETIDKESIFSTSEIEILSEDYGELGIKQEYTIPEEVLFDSGKYQFKYRVKTRDKGGLWSNEYSNWQDFCVVAFDSPKIKEIVHPSLSQPVGMAEKIKALNPIDPETHISISKNMSAEELPRTKAGGKVGLLLNGIGLNVDSVKDSFKVFYKNDFGDNENVVFTNNPKVDEEVGTNNKFLLEFYTSSNIDICPNETIKTIIQGEFEGKSHNTHTEMVLSPDSDLNYYYADGLLMVDGTVLNDWMIVLQGRK